MTSEAEQPWKGDQYDAGYEGLRILIVGESHYSDDPLSEPADITPTVMSAYLSDPTWPFFGTIERIVSGQRQNAVSSSLFWNQVAFLNFVSQVVGKGQSPNPQQYRKSLSRFRKIVIDLESDLVCFFSRASWEYRPWGDAPWEEAFGAEPQHHDKSYEITKYDTYWGSPIIMARFNHPARLNVPVDIWRVWFKHVQAIAANLTGDRPDKDAAERIAG